VIILSSTILQKIKKGTIRLIKQSEYKIDFKGGKHSFYGKAYICYKCIKEELHELQCMVSNLKKEHRKLNNRALVKKTKIILELEPEEESKIIKYKEYW